MSLQSLLNSGSLTQESLLREARRRGLDAEIVSPEEQERRQAELVRCATDPIYFINNYVKTYDPRDLSDPYVSFVLMPRQEELVRWIVQHIRDRKPGVIEKSKDTGVSWIFCAVMFYYWRFAQGFAGGLGSRKLEYVDQKGDPKSLFEKFRIILRYLPAWMKPPGFNPDEHDLVARLINPAKGSTIIGEGGIHIGRGGRTTVYGVDEYNFLEDPDAADSALADNTDCQIYIGTPNGPLGLYTKRDAWDVFQYSWIDDTRKDVWNEFDRRGSLVANGRGRHPSAPIPRFDSYPTRAHSGNVVRYPWYEARREKYKTSPWIVKQETDIDYIGSGSPRFDRDFILKLKERLKGVAPIRTENVGDYADNVSGSWSGELKTWREPQDGHYYLIVADVAEGESANTDGDPDYSVAHVYDCEDWFQCAVYRGRPDTYSFALDLSVLGVNYYYAELCVERTGPGIATIKALVETDIAYPNVYGVRSSENTVKHGMVTTPTAKKVGNEDLAALIIQMKEGFEGVTWNEPETLDQMFHFVRDANNREHGAKGHHDDDVTCCRMMVTRMPELTTRRQIEVGAPDPPQQAYMVGRRSR